MQFSTNKTKRTRKSAEESATASLEGSAARVEENAKPRQKRTAEKSAEPPVMTNHRKATKKADPQPALAIEPLIARQPVTAGAFINDRIVKRGISPGWLILTGKGVDIRAVTRKKTGCAPNANYNFGKRDPALRRRETNFEIIRLWKQRH